MEQGSQAIGNKSANSAAVIVDQENDEEMHGQMEQNLIDFLQDKSLVPSTESLLSEGQDFYAGGEF